MTGISLKRRNGKHLRLKFISLRDGLGTILILMRFIGMSLLAEKFEKL